MAQKYYELTNAVDEYLHQPGPINDLLSKLEKTTGFKRIYFAQGLFGIFAVYMIFGHFAELICNFIGFVYPAYASIKAIETTTKDDDTSWLTYWVVFACFSVAEFFSDIIFSWFPLYWLAKILFLVWCFLPIAGNGRDFVYQSLIRPVFLRNSGRIEAFSQKAKAVIKGIKEGLESENEDSKHD